MNGLPRGVGWKILLVTPSSLYLPFFLPCSNSEPVHSLFEMFHVFSCNNLGGHLGVEGREQRHMPPIKKCLDCWINSYSFQQKCVGNGVNNKHTDIRVKVVSELYLDSHGTTAIRWWYVFWISKRFVSCQKQKLSVSKMYVKNIYFFSLVKKKILDSISYFWLCTLRSISQVSK